MNLNMGGSMWKNEFLRNFCSIKTLIVLVLLISIGIMNIKYEYNSYQNFEHLYNTYVGVENTDINANGALKMMEYYNGMEFGIRFLLKSEFIEINAIILFLFVRINYFVARTDYKKYLKSMLLAHSLYILSIVSISIFIILSLGVIITGKLIGPAYLGIYDINFLGFLGIVLLQIFLISFFAILINGISEVLNVWIKNKIIVQTIPFAFFTLVPMTISSTLGNIFITFGNVITLFVPFVGLKGLMNLVQSDSTYMDVITMALPFVCYTVLFIVLYKINIKKYMENCL